MTFKKKNPAPDAATPTTEEPTIDYSNWKYEDGTTPDTPAEIRAKWLTEYKRRQKEVLPTPEIKEPLFKPSN